VSANELVEGKPLLMAVNGDAADLVPWAQCGLAVEPENVQAMAGAINALVAMPANDLKTMGKNASRFYREALCLEVGAGKFARVFECLSRKVRG